MTSPNAAVATLNPAYIPGLVDSALEVLSRGGSVLFAHKEEKKLVMGFEANGVKGEIKVNKHNFRRGPERVAKQLGDTALQGAGLNEATKNAFRVPVLSEAVGEIVRNQGKVVKYAFSASAAHMTYATKDGKTHDITVRPGARQKALAQITKVFAS